MADQKMRDKKHSAMVSELAGTGEAGSERAPVAMWVARLKVPPMSLSTLDCLQRLPVRRPADQIPGRWQWLPRLGVSVLAHERTEAGWLCTLVAADSHPERLPTGICVVDEVEMSRAIATRWPWDVLAGLSPDEYRDTWRIRAADRGAPIALCETLLASVEDTPTYPADLYPADLDPTGWTVTLDAAVRVRSGCRSTAGLQRQCQRLVDTGLLTRAEDPDTGPGGGSGTGRDAPARYRVALPPTSWPGPSAVSPGGPVPAGSAAAGLPSGGLLSGGLAW